ncbi:hypothetical protein B0H17DRAFT_862861, partial [Mycena rosella]
LLRIVQQLRRRHDAISRDLPMKRSLIAPIRRLPPEILLEVFSLAVLMPVVDSGFDPCITVTDIIHVCHYWRIVALDTSTLW